MSTQQTIFAVVSVEDSEGDVEQTYLINYSHHATRVWYTDLLVWALTNNKSILVDPATSGDIKGRKLFIPREKEQRA